MAHPAPGQKTVLVTGCTPGGIGYALCIEYQKRGLFVIPTARKPDVLHDLAAKGMRTVVLDVTKADSIAAAHKEVAAITGGKLDILVNNAGRTHTHPATDLDLDDVRMTFETNVFSVMAMCKAFADLLIASKGLIINTSSVSSVAPYCFGAAYTATKAAVAAYSRVLRIEMRPFGVRVMVTMTGTVISNNATHNNRYLPPDSLYQRVKDLFEFRVTFSQTQASMPAEDYARQLVTKSLKPEVNLFWRNWFGRPDWFWYGGMAKLLWFGHSFLGEAYVDWASWPTFRLAKLQRMVEEDDKQKKLA
ncbi:uncharacterized protein B0I36DRAFT_321739 [Microdochium trichocladiopsis]|uniref:NADPH-dependent 1-acyldihydroxyacetone phosphate reductase n=1 Tax=Microdochium trichocladiopsis TaxID=1682393 RepID=A0A9P8YAI1_9PEZI|nr:uncharacterized protein B0I36DRAFT_321739 [Microdochium trichocladiopsis]KAH7033601.1 hypothetical protein B0I36DRAFT_321739 [Microdochium trichocladiopsis]